MQIGSVAVKLKPHHPAVAVESLPIEEFQLDKNLLVTVKWSDISLVVGESYSQVEEQMVGCQFPFLLRDMYHQLNWFTVGIFLASLLAIAENIMAINLHVGRQAI